MVKFLVKIIIEYTAIICTLQKLINFAEVIIFELLTAN